MIGFRPRPDAAGDAWADMLAGLVAEHRRLHAGAALRRPSLGARPIAVRRVDAIPDLSLDPPRAASDTGTEGR